jgi:transposase
LAGVVYAAKCGGAPPIHDTVSGSLPFVLAIEKYPSIIGVCADAGYRGTFKELVEDCDLKCDISEKIKPVKWQILPKRWRVERTFAWINNSRRLSKDYVFLNSSQETIVKISNAFTILRRY